MSDKSHVTMEQQVCAVCGKKFSTGNILLDRKLRNAFDQYTVTGYGMCDEHAKLRDDGYVALIAMDPEKSSTQGDSVRLDDVFRTGTVAHVRKSLWAKIIRQPEMTQEQLLEKPFVFVTDDFITALAKITNSAN